MSAFYSCSLCPTGGQCAACAELDAAAVLLRAQWVAALLADDAAGRVVLGDERRAALVAEQKGDR